MPPTCKFPRLLWEAARTDQTGSIWFNPDGDGFYIDPAKFRQNYLDAGWVRSARYNCFAIQLNFYGFRQEHNWNPRGPVKLYRNDNFRADRADLLDNIKRKPFTTGHHRGPQKRKNEDLPPPLVPRPDVAQPNWMRNYPARPAFNPQLSGFRPQLSGGFDQQKSGFNQQTSGFQTGMSGFQPRMSGFNQQMSGFQPRMSGFNQQMSGFEPRMSGFNQQMSGFQPRMSGFQPRMSGFQPRMSGFNQQMSGFQPRMSGFQPRMSGFNQQTPGFQPEMSGIKQEMSGFQPKMSGIKQEMSGLQPGMSGINYGPPPNYAAKQVKIEPIATEQGDQYGDVVSLTHVNLDTTNPVLDEIIQIYPEFYN